MFRALIAVLLIPFPAASAEPVKLKEYKEVVYSTVEKEDLRLELIVPDTPGPHPVVICFHGGAWSWGDRLKLCGPSTFNPGGKDKGMLNVLAENGFAAASVGYRLAPRHRFPAQIIDAKSAVGFLRSNAKKYDLDPDRVAALGYSAGGHLASLLGTTDRAAGFDPKGLPETDCSVKCVVNFYGPCDLTAYGQSRLVEDAFMVPVLGKECRTDPTIYKRASPIEYVGKTSAPTLFIHGTDDIVVPLKQSEAMRDKLQAAGVTAELLTLKGKSHGWEGDTADESAAAAVRFLKAQLKRGEK